MFKATVCPGVIGCEQANTLPNIVEVKIRANPMAGFNSIMWQLMASFSNASAHGEDGCRASTKPRVEILTIANTLFGYARDENLRLNISALKILYNDNASMDSKSCQKFPECRSGVG